MGVEGDDGHMGVRVEGRWRGDRVLLRGAAGGGGGEVGISAVVGGDGG
jgi:hypothetical protein